MRAQGSYDLKPIQIYIIVDMRDFVTVGSHATTGVTEGLVEIVRFGDCCPSDISRLGVTETDLSTQHPLGLDHSEFICLLLTIVEMAR